MPKIDLAGLKIDALSRPALLEQIAGRLRAGQKTFICTPYSEFLYAGLRQPEILAILNSFDFSVADGTGILWAAEYLKLPLSSKSYAGRIAEAFWQAVRIGFRLFLRPSALRKTLPEKISGVDLVWDLAKLAAENSYSVYLLGGFGNTPRLAAERLKIYLLITYNLQLVIAGYSSKNPDDPSVIADIQKSAADFLFVAYGPIKQEEWLTRHKNDLSAKLAIGLGGTFDYLAGLKPRAPRYWQNAGLEWLYRLLTQPRRVKRIYRATLGLVSLLARYKVFRSYPFRQNVAAIVFNQEGSVLINQRAPNNFKIEIIGSLNRRKRQNYWQFPQGGINPGEDAAAAAQREAREETGLSDLEFIGLSPSVNNYFWNNALRKFWPNRKFKYCGQSQQVAYFLYRGPDGAVRVDGREFIAYKWVPVGDLDKEVHSERSAVAKIVQRDFGGLIDAHKFDKI